MLRRLLISSVLALSSLSAVEAAAQQLTAAQRQALRNACEADLKQVCAGVQPGGGRIAACAKANFAKLSPPCQQAMLALKQGG